MSSLLLSCVLLMVPILWVLALGVVRCQSEQRSSEDKSSTNLPSFSDEASQAESVQHNNEHVLRVSEGEWFSEVAGLRPRFPVVTKYNEFYVALENARRAGRLECVAEFQPLLESYWNEISLSLDSCLHFVHRGHTLEYRVCCETLSQPLVTSLITKLAFLSACTLLQQ